MRVQGLLVKHLRTVRGWSQPLLAENAGLSLRTIQRVESESQASLETLSALAATLEVPLEQLLEVPRVSSDQLRPAQLGVDVRVVAVSILAGGLIGALVTWLWLAA
ncbi:MAG: hypothetical protein RL320_979 [Pseudomonadota bacterium]|jgi:transcriptional regulator with XRE-family HTH domain